MTGQVTPGLTGGGGVWSRVETGTRFRDCSRSGCRPGPETDAGGATGVRVGSPGAERWRENPGTALSDEERARGAARLQKAGEDLARYEAAMSDTLAGVQRPNRRRATGLSRRVYALVRKQQGEELVRRLAQAMSDSTRAGLSRRAVLKIVVAGCRAMERALRPGELARLEPGAQSAAEPDSREGTMTKKPKRAVPATRLAGELGAITAGLDELDDYRFRRSAPHLTAALATMDPVTRRVVSRRMAGRASYAELAEEFRLTIEQVSSLLTEARAVVRRYSAYFDDDVFWVEGALPRAELSPGPGK